MRQPRPQGFPKIAAQLFGRPLAITEHHAEIMARVFDEKLGIAIEKPRRNSRGSAAP